MKEIKNPSEEELIFCRALKFEFPVTEYYGLMQPPCNGHCSYIPVDEKVTLDLLRKHYEGLITLGAYFVKPKTETTTKITLDFDGRHSDKTREDVLKTIQYCKDEYNIAPTLSDSGSLESYHIDISLRHPEHWSKVNVLGKNIVETLGVDAEVFPKTGAPKRGELIKIPGGINLKTGRRCPYLKYNFEPFELKAGICAMQEYTMPKLPAFTPANELHTPKAYDLDTHKHPIRYCFKMLIQNAAQLNGEAGHQTRLALLRELIFTDTSDNQIHNVFALQEDYSQRIIDTSIKQFRDDPYRPWKSDTLRDKCGVLITQWCGKCPQHKCPNNAAAYSEVTA